MALVERYVTTGTTTSISSYSDSYSDSTSTPWLSGQYYVTSSVNYSNSSASTSYGNTSSTNTGSDYATLSTLSDKNKNRLKEYWEAAMGPTPVKRRSALDELVDEWVVRE